MKSDRRSFLQQVMAAAAAATVFGKAMAADASDTAGQPVHDMSAMPADWTGKEQVAMLLYPGFTAQDLVGPQYMFANLMGATVHLVAQSMAPVMSDTGLAIMPTTDFARCPMTLDILFVPGGSEGTLAAMSNAALIDFVGSRGTEAKWVTSVCTGSLILAKAGLLDGYRATSHWVARNLLSEAGAIPVDQRVVIDRNRITGAGVTAGIDFGLGMVAMLRDQEYAETVQLLAEYAPEPPFNAGTPASAPAAVIDMIKNMFIGFNAQAGAILKSGSPAP